MAIEDLIRSRRRELGITQASLADHLCQSARDPTGAPGRDAVKRWESGKVVPGPHWQAHLAVVLAIPLEQVRAEATISRVNRRNFLSLSALVAANGVVGRDLIASIAAGDAGRLATVQTSHAEDITTATMADIRSIAHMRSWATGDDRPVLRVNALGILAKIPGGDHAVPVARILADDVEARALYLTAVTARAGAIPWALAADIVADPTAHPMRAPSLANRLTHETLNPRDAGARWCAAHMIRELSPLLGGTP